MDVKLSELRHRDVLDISSATTVGRVQGLVIDFTEQQVSALTIDKASIEASVLPWDQVKSIGPDAVTIDGSTGLRAPSGPAEERVGAKTDEPIGKRVLTEFGDQIGTVDDVVIDDRSGTFRGLIVDGRPLDAQLVMGIGDHAAVVRQPPS